MGRALPPSGGRGVLGRGVRPAGRRGFREDAAGRAREPGDAPRGAQARHPEAAGDPGGSPRRSPSLRVQRRGETIEPSHRRFSRLFHVHRDEREYVRPPSRARKSCGGDFGALRRRDGRGVHERGFASRRARRRLRLFKRDRAELRLECHALDARLRAVETSARQSLDGVVRRRHGAEIANVLFIVSRRARRRRRARVPSRRVTKLRRSLRRAAHGFGAGDDATVRAHGARVRRRPAVRRVGRLGASRAVPVVVQIAGEVVARRGAQRRRRARARAELGRRGAGRGPGLDDARRRTRGHRGQSAAQVSVQHHEEGSAGRKSARGRARPPRDARHRHAAAGVARVRRAGRGRASQLCGFRGGGGTLRAGGVLPRARDHALFVRDGGGAHEGLPQKAEEQRVQVAAQHAAASRVVGGGARGRERVRRRPRDPPGIGALRFGRFGRKPRFARREHSRRRGRLERRLALLRATRRASGADGGDAFRRRIRRGEARRVQRRLFRGPRRGGCARRARRRRQRCRRAEVWRVRGLADSVRR